MAGQSQGYQHALCLRAVAIAAYFAAFLTASAQQPQLSFNGRFVINTNGAFPQVCTWESFLVLVRVDSLQAPDFPLAWRGNQVDVRGSCWSNNMSG